MLFQKERGQFLTQQTRHLLPLGERNEVVLVRLGEHSLECSTGAQQPTLAKCLPILAVQKSPTFHGGSSKTALNVESADRESC